MVLTANAVAIGVTMHNVVLPHFLWFKPKIGGRNFRLLRLYAMPGIGSTQSEGEPIMCDIVRHTHISFIQHLLKSLYGEGRAREIKAAMYPCPCDYYGSHDGTPGLLPWICRLGLG